MSPASNRVRGLIALVAVAAVGTACTSRSSGPSEPTPRKTVTSTETLTHPPTSNPSAFTPAPASSVAPLRPGAKPPEHAKRKLCPYIRSGLDEDPTSKSNVADIQGNRVGQTTVLTDLTPVGCRFYFAYDYQAVADILPRTFASADDAHNAMVRTADAGRAAQSVPDFVPGVDGISYRTRFYGPDGDKDWAFVFAKGKVMVVVHTEEKTTSQNALFLAKAIVAKF